MLPQLERQYLSAKLAGARELLALASPSDDPIGHFQYEQLVHELEADVAATQQQMSEAPAALAMFFGGRPVLGSQGIDAAFGSKAVEKFQALVSQRFAAESFGPLSGKGPVPSKQQSAMMVTDVVRGSFGFVLQAVDPVTDAGDVVDLKTVIDKVADTISRVSAQDESLFESAAEEIDERQKSALTDFFKLLDDSGATLRIVEGTRDFELKQDAVQRARSRVEGMSIRDHRTELTGYIVGWTDNSARFELQPHDRSPLMQGTIASEVIENVKAEGLTLYHAHVKAKFKKREITARGRQPRVSYTLVGVDSVPAPHDWPTAPVQTRLTNG